MGTTTTTTTTTTSLYEDPLNSSLPPLMDTYAYTTTITTPDAQTPFTPQQQQQPLNGFGQVPCFSSFARYPNPLGLGLGPHHHHHLHLPFMERGPLTPIKAPAHSGPLPELGPPPYDATKVGEAGWVAFLSESNLTSSWNPFS
ncbi:uncharacterized protein LOC109712297 [Ananas comosus]|uniref:Uncharacterized protein LOC109712297 n=1 Tax=Ananas comosus TaxID=4615 RepID=A0A6P5F6Y3_ANACO|nr:uncharacterized protein LOC109712297 [Ananas comosus]